MTTSQVLLRRYSDVDINNLLSHFVDTLLDVEQELEAASDWQWDTIVRDACRKRKNEVHLTCDEGDTYSETEPTGISEVLDADIIPFERPRDPK